MLSNLKSLNSNFFFKKLKFKLFLRCVNSSAVKTEAELTTELVSLTKKDILKEKGYFKNCTRCEIQSTKLFRRLTIDR